MNRILSSLFALAMCASLATVAMAATVNHPMAAHHMMKKHSCAKKGQIYVHGYMKNGKWVKGYCRNK
ncbi:MAG: hypothetical protein JO018_02130 [Candidatus Eremiobacteraeota bacterium]|nr:hypothetical protein [Candidatus Eremiobacteraeota bacterium]